MTLGRQVAVYTILSVLAGVVGGGAGLRWFDAPFYFGFFLMFVLSGMASLFALAAHIEGRQNRH